MCTPSLFITLSIPLSSHVLPYFFESFLNGTLCFQRLDRHFAGALWHRAMSDGLVSIVDLPRHAWVMSPMNPGSAKLLAVVTQHAALQP